MLFKILMRTGGVVVFGLLLLLRIWFVGNAVNHARHAAVQPDAAYSPSPRANYRNAAIASAADGSRWILFSSTDPHTGQRTRHARLTAASDVIIDGHAGPPNVLELLEQGPEGHHIRLTLQAPATCPGITSVHAAFGSQPTMLAVKPVDHEAGCTMEMLDYATILQSLRDADELTVSAGNGPNVRFEVAGLSWD
jgi:hypothetical protein